VAAAVRVGAGIIIFPFVFHTLSSFQVNKEFGAFAPLKRRSCGPLCIVLVIVYPPAVKNILWPGEKNVKSMYNWYGSGLWIMPENSPYKHIIFGKAGQWRAGDTRRRRIPVI